MGIENELKLKRRWKTNIELALAKFSSASSIVLSESIVKNKQPDICWRWQKIKLYIKWNVITIVLPLNISFDCVDSIHFDAKHTVSEHNKCVNAYWKPGCCEYAAYICGLIMKPT